MIIHPPPPSLSSTVANTGNSSNNHNNSSTTSAVADLPFWLLELCDRLKQNQTTDNNKDKKKQPAASSVTNCNLNIRRLNVPMMEALAEAVACNGDLQVLNLTSSLTGGAGAGAASSLAHAAVVPAGGRGGPITFPNTSAVLLPLARTALPHHASLRILHLNYNLLHSVQCLGPVLKTNQVLRELHLDYNFHIDSRSAVSLAEGLRYNTSLRVLQLGCNRIGDVGCCALAAALGADNNHGKNDHANQQSLQKILPVNRTLKLLGLRRNGISNVGATAILSALHNNHTLQVVELSESEDDNDNDDDEDRPMISPTVLSQIRILCRANQLHRDYFLAEQQQQQDKPTKQQHPTAKKPPCAASLEPVPATTLKVGKPKEETAEVGLTTTATAATAAAASAAAIASPTQSPLSTRKRKSDNKHILSMAVGIGDETIPSISEFKQQPSKPAAATAVTKRAVTKKNNKNSIPPLALWPLLLQKIKKEPDMIYFFLTAKPDLITIHNNNNNSSNNNHTNCSSECDSHAPTVAAPDAAAAAAATTTTSPNVRERRRRLG